MLEQIKRIIEALTWANALARALVRYLREAIRHVRILKKELAELDELYTAKTITFFIKGKEVTMQDLTATQEVDVTLKITTAKGKPAVVDGTPVWSSSDEAVATVQPANDGMSAVIKAVNDEGGICQVTVTGDADLGAGVAPITGFLDVVVAAGDGAKAAVFELVAGTPREQATT